LVRDPVTGEISVPAAEPKTLQEALAAAVAAVLQLMALTNQADAWPPEVSPAKRKKAAKLARDVHDGLDELRKVATPKEKPAKGAD
jgi:hypothetical protein